MCVLSLKDCLQHILAKKERSKTAYASLKTVPATNIEQTIEQTIEVVKQPIAKKVIAKQIAKPTAKPIDVKLTLKSLLN